MHTDFVLDALKPAPHARRPFAEGELILHSNGGSLRVSIRYSERLAVDPMAGEKFSRCAGDL